MMGWFEDRCIEAAVDVIVFCASQGVHESKGVSSDYLKLESLVQKVVSPYLGTHGLFSGDGSVSHSSCVLGEQRHSKAHAAVAADPDPRSFAVLREAAPAPTAPLRRLAREEPRGALQELQHPHADAGGRVRPRERRRRQTPLRVSDDLLRGGARRLRGSVSSHLPRAGLRV